jgi:hypothetical protein
VDPDRRAYRCSVRDSVIWSHSSSLCISLCWSYSSSLWIPVWRSVSISFVHAIGWTVFCAIELAYLQTQRRTHSVSHRTDPQPHGPCERHSYESSCDHTHGYTQHTAHIGTQRVSFGAA